MTLIPKEKRAKVKELLRKKQNSRTPRAKKMDASRRNADTITTNNARVKTWVRAPGQLDVKGIDTPRKRRKSKK